MKISYLSQELSVQVHLISFFYSVFTREDHSSNCDLPELDYPFIPPVDINIEGITKLLNLKVSVSSGLDNIN